MKTIDFGIEGMDKLLPEGIPFRSNVLVYGKPGCGKTIFALDYIYKGSIIHKENGVYVSLEQNKDELIEQAKKFGWDLKKQIDQKKISIVHPSITEIDRDFLNNIISEVKRMKAKRLVIDTISLMASSPIFSTESKFSLLDGDKMKIANTVQQFIYNTIHILDRCDVTALYLTIPDKDEYSTQDGFSEYICDGLINLRKRSLGRSSLRTIEVMKMRKVRTNDGIYSFEITDKGIVVE